MAKLQDKFFNRVIEGDLELDGPVKGDFELESSGKAKIFENIVDKDGHPRFIEGDIEIQESTPLTKVYGKWSLSGSHLMIVLAGTAVAGTTLADNTFIVYLNNTIPQWIRNKIYPIQGGLVANCVTTFYKENQFWVNENKTLSLYKADDVLAIRNVVGDQTITNDSSFRLEFDLLIDNE